MDGVDNIGRFDECLKSIREKLRAVPLVVQFPIGAGRELEGLIDIVEQKAHYFQLGDKNENYQTKEIPSHLTKKTQKYRQELLEKLVEIELEKMVEEGREESPILQKYEKKEELSGAEIKKLLRQVTLTGRYFPTFCGSAYKHVGVKLLLDGVVDYLPSPLDVPKITVYSPRDKNKTGEINCNSPLSCLALAFKIIFDDYNNKLTFFRVYAGKVESNSYVYNVNKKRKERVSRLFLMHANDKEIIKEVGAGNIAVAIGLENTVTGDTLGEENKTGQMIIAGMGEVHLEVLVERLRREFKLAIESKQQRVSYRETITKKVKLAFEPNPGKGFEFVDAKKGQEMSDKDAEEVKEGLEESMSSGLLLSYPLLDIKATLLEGKRHEVDTKPGDFKNAAVLAFRGDGVAEKEKRIKELGVVLLEPIMQTTVIVPKDYLGDTLASLGRCHAVIENTEEKEGESFITGKAPLRETLNYLATLRQLTGGRGAYSSYLSHYQAVAKDTLEEILKEKKLLNTSN
ncbi:36631_t:CDS:2 [Racocetra persica]|uniref:36631_t:CDS:1 n=1 Tax=Racocetra persica TaxID=160502 RepID=A0ACA9NVH0_9GLOM|nr:36631_t:CDS:2 [Racocetra persica]